jgi:DNA helicase-2/ATP-dependent DNA helicase PcrA
MLTLPDALLVPGTCGTERSLMVYSPAQLADALGLPAPTEEQAAVIAAPPGPLVVIAGAGAGKTETMAARVVWLVANGIAEPGQVLGLTFTRKAAGQLLRRVRSRLARLAGYLGGNAAGAAPTVSTYHAFAGSLLRDHGVLLPVEPDVRLLTATELWQLAYEVVKSYPGPLETDKSPARITDMVIRLSGELAEHLVDTHQLLDSHTELERLAYHLPPGRYQRADGPNQWLRNVLEVQSQRTALVPLVDALHARMRDEKVMDFGAQMAAAARLVSKCPQVGEQLRSRYRVVLLDEYQDTGHAQRIALSSLFGGGVDPELALTAVGDPIQSIYGWRGASAANLPRFATDFPNADGSPAPTLELLTSWRNPPSALHIANAISAEARQRSVIVRALRPRPGAGEGTVSCALLNDVDAERNWLADQIADRYRAATEAGDQPPTAAVLLRRNADAGPIAQALTARGVPVEVVGLSGLLSISEVADVVAMLRLVAEPTAGSAAIRVLTGPRWRLGAHDLSALWRRATVLMGPQSGSGTTAAIAASVAPEADTACLADALADPGPAAQYSAEGFRRITALSGELTWLRGYLTHSVTELLSEVRRVLGADVEARANVPPESGWVGAEHLDKFAEVVEDYAQHSNASIFGLLEYLSVAETVEKGLAPAELNVAADRVQVLTVHAAKGLEWELVAIPHLSGRIFPSAGVSARTWLSDAAALPPLLRGDRAADGLHGVPVLDVSAVTDRKALADNITAHRDLLERRRVDEERRLLYVAITRSEDTLLISGHHWGATGSKPCGPSDFLCEIKDIIEASIASGMSAGELVEWAPSPADGDRNPLRDKIDDFMWPQDPLGSRRAQVANGAALVAAAQVAAGQVADGQQTDTRSDAQDDPEGWITAVDALIAERNREPSTLTPDLPGLLSVSSLVELKKDRTAAARRLTRRLPSRPDPHAILGTAFHQWVQRFYGAERLFDLDDLPGAMDADPAGSEELATLQEAFTASKWAARTPIDVEVPFEMAIGDTIVRGRIDAVFADPDGGMTVVDWKTGAAPADPEARRNAAVQLGAYRLAWAALRGCPETQVRAAFHYVRSGRTVVPESMPGPDELVQLLAGPAASGEPRAESPSPA